MQKLKLKWIYKKTQKKNLHDLKVDKHFLAHRKNYPWKNKIIDWISQKLKISALQKKPFLKRKDKLKTEKKYLNVYIWQKSYTQNK